MENNPVQQAGLPQQDYYAEQHHGGEDPFPLFDYLQLLWFRRHLIIAVSLFVAVLGFIYVNQLRPVYTATSTLMIGATQTQVVDIEQVLSRDSYGYQATAEVEVLRSRGRLQKSSINCIC